METPKYIVITPVRNGEANVGRTIDSMTAQTMRPSRWVLVNDGSTDRTREMVEQAAAKHPWIGVVNRSDRGFRKSGGGVVEAFYDGYALSGGEPWDYLAKLDGDLSFNSDYFEHCFEHFERNARLGIGGGTVCRRGPNGLVEDSHGDPKFHVRGATKIYRHACWEQIGGLIKAPGWDTVDEVKANMLGWETRTFPELKVQQLKDTGSADGIWRNWVKNGLANYITGYHPLFMLCKCAKRLLSKPYLVGATGLGYGFISGYARGIPRVDDSDLILYVRKQQFRKLTFRDSIWG